MKSKLLSLFAIFIALNCSGQTSLFQGGNVLLPTNLNVIYNVGLDSTSFENIEEQHIVLPYLKNIKDNSLIQILLEPVLSAKVTCYDPYGMKNPYQIEKRKLELREIEEQIGKKTIDIKILNDNGEVLRDSTVVLGFDPNEIIGLRFLEKWSVSEEPFSFSKNVISFNPIRKYKSSKTDSGYSFSLLFQVIDSLRDKKIIKQSDDRMVLTNKISYEYQLYASNSEAKSLAERINQFNKYLDCISNTDFLISNPNSEYFTNFGILRFINLVIEKAISGQMIVLDFKTKERLSVPTIKQNLGLTTSTVVVNDLSTGELKSVEINDSFDNKLIKSVIFNENWYIDPITLRMKKTVTGLAPVVYSVDTNEKNELKIKKKVLFEIHF